MVIKIILPVEVDVDFDTFRERVNSTCELYRDCDKSSYVELCMNMLRGRLWHYSASQIINYVSLYLASEGTNSFIIIKEASESDYFVINFNTKHDDMLWTKSERASYLLMLLVKKYWDDRV